MFQQEDNRNKGHNMEELSWVPILVKMLSAPWKIITAEER
jgi:hypothetical protein